MARKVLEDSSQTDEESSQDDEDSSQDDEDSSQDDEKNVLRLTRKVLRMTAQATPMLLPRRLTLTWMMVSLVEGGWKERRSYADIHQYFAQAKYC